VVGEGEVGGDGNREYDCRGLVRGLGFFVGDESGMVELLLVMVPSQSVDSKLLVALLSSSGKLLAASLCLRELSCVAVVLAMM